MEDCILSYSEIEVYVSNFLPSKVEELGTLSWIESHKRLHTLYQEALLQTIKGKIETIKETFLIHGKVKVLVFEAISLSVWRLKVFPYFSDAELDKEKVFVVFIILYHEATAFGLLESLAFHPDCVESLQDSAVELLDYCIHNILEIINREVPRVVHEKLSDFSPLEEIKHYDNNIVHNLAMRSICVLRFIAENFEQLPLSISSQYYINHDVPMLLCKVIELAPWFTTDLEDKPYQYIDGIWKRREKSEEAMNKSEGQTWLCLRQVLLDQRLTQHYELSDYRKQQLCKLIRYLHDDVLDQLSPLSELKYFLCQLSVASLPPPQSRPLILEIIPQFKEKLLKKFSSKWKDLAANQMSTIKGLDITEVQRIATGLASAYKTLDMVEPEPVRCANCGDLAAKRCSRCKSEWYCGRECQVKRWEKHKSFCNLVTDSHSQ